MDDFDELEQELKLAEARSRLAALSDETLVPEMLACIYLNISPKQLKTLREKASGPEFFKPIAKGAEKANISASYEMGELRRWKKEHIFESNLDVANRTGINRWVGEPRPFFTEDFGRRQFSILAAADDISRDDWGDNLASAIEGGPVHVEWLVPAEAAASRWRDFTTHQKFASGYLAELDAERSRVSVALTASELASGI
jgi:hypothetical protein